MQKYDANSWELYRGKTHTDKIKEKKWKKAKRDNYNKYMIGLSKRNARAMRREPSELEKKMMIFLDNHHVYYEFQKPFHIKDDKGFIRKFYIADFFIPKLGLIIETDGKFHDNQTELDKIRTIDIQTHCGDYKVIRWRWHDFESIVKIRRLLSILI